MPRPAARRGALLSGRGMGDPCDAAGGGTRRRWRRGCRPPAHAGHAAGRDPARARPRPAQRGRACPARCSPRPKGRLGAACRGLPGGVPFAGRRACRRRALAGPARPSALLADRLGRCTARRERQAAQGDCRSQGPARCKYGRQRQGRHGRPGGPATTTAAASALPVALRSACWRIIWQGARRGEGPRRVRTIGWEGLRAPGGAREAKKP